MINAQSVLSDVLGWTRMRSLMLSHWSIISSERRFIRLPPKAAPKNICKSFKKLIGVFYLHDKLKFLIVRFLTALFFLLSPYCINITNIALLFWYYNITFTYSYISLLSCASSLLSGSSIWQHWCNLCEVRHLNWSLPKVHQCARHCFYAR